MLKHAGILHGVAESGATRWLDMPSDDCFGFSAEDGLVEFLADLGDPVRKGDIIARIHRVDRTGLAPEPHRAAMDGLLAARHFPGLIKQGDCLSVLAVEVAKP